MLRIIVGKLDEETTKRAREVFLRIASVETNPRAYSQTETEMILRAHRQMWREIYRLFELSPERKYELDLDSECVVVMEQSGE